MTAIHEYRPLRNAYNVSPPSEEGVGFWWNVDASFSGPEYWRSFIEIHPSSTGRKICIRISNYIFSRRQVRLGECVLLTREQCKNLISHLESIGLWRDPIAYTPLGEGQELESCPSEDPNSLWVCSCDPDPWEFLEVFRSDGNVQLRISSFILGKVKLGHSVTLDSRKIERIIQVMRYLMTLLSD